MTTIIKRAINFSIMLLLAAILVPSVQAQGEGYRIEIPAIDVNAPIVDVHIKPTAEGNVTWDFSGLTYQVGYMVGTMPLGQAGNTVLGAHSELAERAPSVFKNLDALQPGDVVVVTNGASRYEYVVTDRYTVPYTELAPLRPTRGDRLTLITCRPESYQGGTRYAERTVVVAQRSG